LQGADSFNKALHLEVSQASAAAAEAVRRVGGSVTTVYYNELGLRALLKPEAFAKKGHAIPRPARPPAKLVGRCVAYTQRPFSISLVNFHWVRSVSRSSLQNAAHTFSH
jgi:large subunit ribosomal protein L15